MGSFYVKKNKVFSGISFIHIPKTGGSSVEFIFKSQFNLSEFGHIGVNHPNMLKYYSFSIFRNPYDRAGSFYNEVLQVINDDNPLIKNLLLKITKNKDPKKECAKGFNYFVENYFDAAVPDPAFPDTLVSPSQTQLSYISKNSKIIVNELLDFDNLDEEWKKIQKITGIKTKFPIKNNGNFKINKNHLSKRAREVINYFYKEDFDFYEHWKNEKNK
jgi:hypothetical protein